MYISQFIIIQNLLAFLFRIVTTLQILLWDLKSLSSKAAIPTVGGTVNALAVSTQTGILYVYKHEVFLKSTI